MKFRSCIPWSAARSAVLLMAPAILAAQGPYEPQNQPDPPPPPPPPKVITMTSGGTFLGVGVREIDAERSRVLSLKEEYGVEVTAVEPESPAAKAGLKVGDAVLEYNGQRVEGTTQFVRFVRETPAGRTVKLLVSRGGATQTIAATLAARKGSAAYGMAFPMEGFKVEMPRMEPMVMPDIPKATMSWRSTTLGVEAEGLGESQFASFFGVKEGVLVRSVVKGSVAEKAGIKAGDVLVKVDDTKVTGPRDVSNVVRNARSASKKTFPITLVREKKETSVTVTFEDDQSERTPAPRSQRVTVRQQL
ncbi:MAG: PDZ domain-containing protein [Acidobacteria bacterium]|nr:PDZ domain-containing protein [Acidobacteriota bacterium]